MVVRRLYSRWPHLRPARNLRRWPHGFDIDCNAGNQDARNTLKCEAAETGTELGRWTGEGSCVHVSCNVPRQIPRTLHASVEQHYLDVTPCTCEFGYSLGGLRLGETQFSVACKGGGTFHVPDVRCQPIMCSLADAPNAKMLEYSGGSLLNSPAFWVQVSGAPG